MTKKARRPGIREVFRRNTLAAGEELADQYDIVVRYEDGEWYGHALEYPEAMGEGKTPGACIAATRKALLIGVATMLEAGQTPPAPARQAVRAVQVNVRLTAEEKALLERRAKAKGFRGLSDFIRASVLASAG